MSETGHSTKRERLAVHVSAQVVRRVRNAVYWTLGLSGRWRGGLAVGMVGVVRGFWILVSIVVAGLLVYYLFDWLIGLVYYLLDWLIGL